MIVESGRHDELLRKGGRYATFFACSFLAIGSSQPVSPKKTCLFPLSSAPTVYVPGATTCHTMQECVLSRTTTGPLLTVSRYGARAVESSKLQQDYFEGWQRSRQALFGEMILFIDFSRRVLQFSEFARLLERDERG